MADNTNNNQSILNASVSDQPSEDDYLGFEPYFIAIAEFLTNPETKPPLTISIEGEWGSGKSSFMTQLGKAIHKAERKKFNDEINKEKEELKEDWEKFKQQKNLKEISNFFTLRSNLLKVIKLRFKRFDPPATIWFNAWRHDKAESLWAAFALEFLAQISGSRNFWKNIPHFAIGYSRLFFSRVEKVKLAISFFYLIVNLAVSIIKYLNISKNFSLKVYDLIESIQQNINISDINILDIINFIFIIFGIICIVQALIKANNQKNDLTKYLKSPKYENHIEFLEEFHRDFKKIVEAFSGQNKVYVFIDDLDRCEITKSAELMQAINMMIVNDPQLIFILGMDVDKVAAGIAVKYKEIIPYLGFDANSRNNRSLSIRAIEYGYNFFEKFVQIRFQIPRPTKYDFQRYLNHISPRKTRKEIIPNNRQNTTPIEKNKEEIFSTETETSTSEEQRNRRIEYIKITTGEDSEVIRNIALMVAPALDYNPRRWKQFINLFRLKAYIAASTSLITTDVSENNSRRYLTLEQLGKFTAISIKWPRLIIDLNTDHQLLKNLQEGALKHPADFSTYNETTKYWGSKHKLVELFRYPAVIFIESKLSDRYFIKNEYSFANLDVEILLQTGDDLSSERGIDYTKLRDFLRDGNWREADKETSEVMIKAVGKTSRNLLTSDVLLNFPCQDLSTIDQLWVKYSGGRFGFSVQKRIYSSVGGKLDGKYDSVAFEKLSIQVGWGFKLTYDINSPEGHLPLGENPVWFCQREQSENIFSSLVSRLVNCNI
ncbi:MULTISPECIES: GUN4 domain-containing protein [Nostocales]|nr:MULTISPECIES: GUN4 domain-containing protein [Nostocales]